MVVLIKVCAEVEVVSVVGSDCKMFSINWSILNQLTNYIYRNVCKDNDQIHIKVLVRERDAVDNKVDNQDEQREICRQNYNHLTPLTKTEVKVGCTNLVSQEENREGDAGGDSQWPGE